MRHIRHALGALEKNPSAHLTCAHAPVEDRSHCQMRRIIKSGPIAIVAALIFCAAAWSQSTQDSDAKAHPAVIPASSRITIEVSGGEKENPIENASVYLKYVEEHKIKKDKKVELNVKTNREGTAHVPDAPTGRVLIQVVADGWKTYGRWYDITDAKQTIKIHLEKPPKWY
jgi:hypothetical protein